MTSCETDRPRAPIDHMCISVRGDPGDRAETLHRRRGRVVGRTKPARPVPAARVWPSAHEHARILHQTSGQMSVAKV